MLVINCARVPSAAAALSGAAAAGAAAGAGSEAPVPDVKQLSFQQYRLFSARSSKNPNSRAVVARQRLNGAFSWICLKCQRSGCGRRISRDLQ